MDGLRRSPGFASEDAWSGNWQFAIGPSIRNLQAAFPGLLPVTGCDLLAYSCAAARELHPLPCLCHKAKTRKPKDISKSGKYQCQEFTGQGLWKSTGRDLKDANRAVVNRESASEPTGSGQQCPLHTSSAAMVFGMVLGKGIRRRRLCSRWSRQIHRHDRANSAAFVDSVRGLRRWHPPEPG